jgi:hypothetical protein
VRVERIGFGLHVLVLAAIVVNLWLGGDLIEAWAGHFARVAFELLLITAYVVLVVGLRVPLRWWRREKR